MNPQQAARAGEMFVAAEFHRRGGYAVTFAGNMPGIDILASDLADTRRISIQVKTKSSGSWHARFPKDAAQCGEDPAETSYWVFVDLGGEHPAYFIAPRWWVCNLGGEVDQLADRESRPRRVCGDRPDAIVRRGAGDVHVSTASSAARKTHDTRQKGREALRPKESPAR